MGYSSSYELCLRNPTTQQLLDPKTTGAIIAAFRDENHNAEYALDENGDCNDSCKWYDAQDELTAFSKKHPTVLFDLYREGEENDDLSHFYALNGKWQEAGAIVTYPAFDPEKLR